MHHTLFVTGGHPTPALAFLEELEKRKPDWRVYWVGRKYAMEGSRVHSSEYRLVQDTRAKFLPLTTGRLQRTFTLHTIPSLFKLPVGFIQSLYYIAKYRPQRILVFGGYIAVPVAVAGFLTGIPVIIHEQVVKPGLANRFLALLAHRICVSFPESTAHVPKGKTVVTGLPLRRGLFHPPASPSFPVPKSAGPILYITGGSTGAQSLNDVLFPLIRPLTEQYTIIHQTGEPSFEKASRMKESLGKYRTRYIPVPYLDLPDLAWTYAHASVVIGRSGANTVAETAAWGKPALFIPLPWSAGSEQEANARAYAASSGKAVVLDQYEITAETVIGLLGDLIKHGLAEGHPVSGNSRAAALLVDAVTGE